MVSSSLSHVNPSGSTTEMVHIVSSYKIMAHTYFSNKPTNMFHILTRHLYISVWEPASYELQISCNTNVISNKLQEHALPTTHADSQNAMKCVMYLSLNQLFNILYGADFDFPCLLVYVLLCTLCHRFPDNPLRLTHLSCALFGTQRELGEIITRGP